MPSLPLPSPVPCPASPQPRRARRKGARPGELLEAALDLFVEKGYSATRVEEVAARAGVSKGTLFLYFPSKEELFKAVVHENLSARFVEWNAEYESFAGSTADMLRYCLTAWWERVSATPSGGLGKLVMAEARNFPDLAAFYHAEVVQPASALIRRIVQRGLDSGEFRAGLDGDYAVYSVSAAILYLAQWKHSLGACVADAAGLDPVRYIDSQVDVLLHGMLARPA